MNGPVGGGSESYVSVPQTPINLPLVCVRIAGKRTYIPACGRIHDWSDGRTGSNSPIRMVAKGLRINIEDGLVHFVGPVGTGVPWAVPRAQDASGYSQVKARPRRLRPQRECILEGSRRRSPHEEILLPKAGNKDPARIDKCAKASFPMGTHQASRGPLSFKTKPSPRQQPPRLPHFS